MEVNDTTLRSLRRRGKSYDEIALLTGLTPEQVQDECRRIWTEANNRSTTIVDPNEHLIMLEASAIRMKWSPHRERVARGSIVEGWTPPDASAEFVELVARRCRRTSGRRR